MGVLILDQAKRIIVKRLDDQRQIKTVGLMRDEAFMQGRIMDRGGENLDGLMRFFDV